MKLGLIIFCTLIAMIAFGQETNGNYIFWSSERKLSVDDFGIKTKNGETMTSFAQFSIDYKLTGFDFMAKDLNNKVRNYIIKSASTIDTTFDTSISLRYQQTLFDLCEIYTRHFRKAIIENRKKIFSGSKFIDELNAKAMTDFTNRRVLYDKDTNFGMVKDKQTEWELQIKKELNELKEFDSE